MSRKVIIVRGFSVNIAGRVKNFPLPLTQPLFPLFEAIVNSFQALEERKIHEKNFSNAHIYIKLQRDGQTTIKEDNKMQPIQNIVIEDNGIGFNKDNFNSFIESDSDYKSDKGGKGVGRFSWLKTFSKVEIESTYKENSLFHKRKFEFNTEENGIDDSVSEIKSAVDNCTIIKLVDFKDNYKKEASKQIDTIAIKIIQHCLIYFMDNECPTVIITDGEIKLSLNNIFNEKINTDNNSEEIIIGDKKFDLLHVKITDALFDGNKLFLCANNRVVSTKDLSSQIVDLDKQMCKDKKFWYIGVVTSEYFDNNVDMNRLSFNIPEKRLPQSFLQDPSMEEIIKEVCDKIEIYLKTFLDEVRNEKNKNIKEYIVKEAPQFRHLLRYKKDEIAKIKPNLSEDKLDDELQKIKRDFDKEIKNENNELLKKLNKGVVDYADYEKRMQVQIAKISDSNSSVLAEYVAHRKVIIDLMEYGINKKEDGKFNKENFIHNIIYPMRTDSDITDYSNHNLWLIDERLSYCAYISSDMPFNQDNNNDRPDIMALNDLLKHPFAVSEDSNDGTEFGTIVIFEFKRPMRNDYNDSDNPITQLYDYVDEIKSGKVKDKNGRPIRVGNNTKFYLYVVCDVLSKMERIINHNSLKITPDGLGYYTYNDVYNAFVEVLPYNKIINDAKKRNKILFDKLGLL